MNAVVIVLVVVAAVAVFAIAAVVIGRESHRLDAVAPRAVYVVDEAIDYVADTVPPESQARLTHDEVRQLLALHMAQLREQGPAAARGRRPRPGHRRRPWWWRRRAPSGYVIGRAEAAGLDVDDVDVVNVVEAHLAYLDAIGAVGPPALGDTPG